MKEELSDIYAEIDLMFAGAEPACDKTGSLAQAVQLFVPLKPRLVFAADAAGTVLAVQQMDPSTPVEWADAIASRLATPLCTVGFAATSVLFADGRKYPVVGVSIKAQEGTKEMLGALIAEPPEETGQCDTSKGDLSNGASLAWMVTQAIDELDHAVARIRHLHAENETFQKTHHEIIEANQRERQERIREKQENILKLEMAVEERSRALREALSQAELAKDTAEAANKSKGDFLAKMSHELRTPMNSIIGFTELMLTDCKDPPSEKRKKRLQKVVQNARNLLQLINDILDLSKVEANKLMLQPEKVNVVETLTDCIELVQPLLAFGVELGYAIEDSLRSNPTWMGDGVRLRQIVINLLSNAAKFTEQGRIDLQACVDGEYLIIAVKDTGIGIAVEHLATIFESFDQVDSSNTRRAKGTGLGLSICKKLCEMLGGEITVTSELGVGSCFTIRLPMIITPAESAPDNNAQPELSRSAK